MLTCNILQQHIASTSGATNIIQFPCNESLLILSYASIYLAEVILTMKIGYTLFNYYYYYYLY